jgi:type IV fimbrial biogenesis protein FimT
MKFGERTEYRRSDRSWGLTVLELMIVLAAIGIIVLVAVPGSPVLLDRYRLKVTTDSFMTALELSRAEANARGIAVVLCPSSNGHTCRRDGDWSHGWLVFTDGNSNGTVQDIELIQAFEASSPKIVIMANGAVQERASFTATGLIPDNGTDSGQFRICLRDSNATVTLVQVDVDGWVQKIPARDEICMTG